MTVQDERQDDNKRKPGADRRPVTLVVDYDGADEMYRDYTENLSTGGVFVHTDRTMEPGDRVELLLSFPRLLAPLCIAGVVRWVRPVGDSDNGVGIEFVDFGDDARRELEEILEHVQERDPNYVEASLRLLLCEDNSHISKLIQEGLAPVRFAGTPLDIITVNNGRDALRLVLEEEFDIVVMDANLPMMDGITVISRLRKERRLQSLPIIVVSAGGQEIEQEAIAAGADFFLAKPMRLRQIVDTMRNLLNRRN
ncbi:MAG: TIGR02266 family protein [Kofleriaceae bacterium]|nr:TIGR02266 family protein [Kofleriaceae bacterium]